MDWKVEYKKQLLTPSNSYLKIQDFVKPYLPRYLYKYGNFGSKYWENIIINGQIFLADANSFNDPFDCLIRFDFDKLFKSKVFNDILIYKYPILNDPHYTDMSKSNKDMKKEILKAIKGIMKVSCFSESWNSILMWSHYADCHKGFCIEYDTKLFSETKKMMFFPVLYQSSITDITENLVNGTRNAGLISIVGKAKEWEYEKEWRMINLTEECRSYYYRKEIRSVILGAECEKKYKNTICNWAENNGKKVYQEKMSLKKYELLKERII